MRLHWKWLKWRLYAASRYKSRAHVITAILHQLQIQKSLCLTVIRKLYLVLGYSPPLARNRIEAQARIILGPGSYI